MFYCPPNITFSDIWVVHGVSHCFLDTVTSSTYGLFLLLFGLGQWLMYRRFATLSEDFIRSKSHLLRLQLALSAVMPLLAVLQLILLATIIGKFVLTKYISLNDSLQRMLYLKIFSVLESLSIFFFLSN